MDETKIRTFLKKSFNDRQDKISGLVHDDAVASMGIRCFKSLDSTNAYAKDWLKSYIRLPALVLADLQTQGRGRLGRSFFSPSGGLYLSMIVDCKGIKPGMLTTLAAVSVLEAAKAMQLPQLQIKWVNDILLQRKKVGGIMAEGISSKGELTSAVIGIGLNTADVQFPIEIEQRAGTLQAEGLAIDRERFAALIFSHFLVNLPEIPSHMSMYRQNCVNIGQQLRFEQKGIVYFGRCEDVDDNGGLLVQTEDGLMRLEAGEVSIRSAAGDYI
ncbi:MAG: biotin--[acetyl-CoA-carboxylase] ligase [Clostridiales bacterium]|nr:biotin--[acetyl-CoA-carboxylase] ligase [Clostridiales bacterium]